MPDFPEPEVKQCEGYTLIGVRDQAGKTGIVIKISPNTFSDQIIGEAALRARLSFK